jgi:hypothetical protein
MTGKGYFFMTAPPVTAFCYNFAMSEHTSDGVALRSGHQFDPILPLIKI